jgi:hypothetical protein
MILEEDIADESKLNWVIKSCRHRSQKPTSQIAGLSTTNFVPLMSMGLHFSKGKQRKSNSGITLLKS